MITAEESRKITLNGVWKQNPGVVQILGMCPTLAMTSTVVNGVSLGVATALVMLVSGMAVASLRQYVPNELRNPVYILIIAALVTVLDLLMNAYLRDLYLVLGIFIPLITTNCIVLARAEAFASKNGVLQSGLDGLMMGIGATVVLAVLGAAREVLGKGTLFAGLDLVLGPQAAHWILHIVPPEYNYQFLLAILPPGAFIGFGFLVAGKAWLDKRASAPEASCATGHAKG
ncbi:electron transport complex protein RnfE [Formivibrio citricus]|uniref:Ion-translocating oxidoreductase complex subunit E n=1 Tax=Formivibrio citricus TaxID=83765 RepID=A0A1I5AFX3_9NEIS|nr:electron transport complex subunit E [Formivibrio citricus]SFN61381.1 electron transport complex protein RnfE [Formivibrio citricus]